MPDQKPTLEYGRPSPPSKGQKTDKVIGVALAAFGLACLVVGAFAIRETVRADSIWVVIAGSGFVGICLIPSFGFLLLYLAWLLLRRRYCD